MILKQNEAFKLVHDVYKKEVTPQTTPFIDVKIMQDHFLK